MKLKRNLYAALGMAAWKYGMPLAKKKMQERRTVKSRQTAATA